MLSLSWPAVHLLGLAPIGNLAPELLGLAWADVERGNVAVFTVRDPERVRQFQWALAGLVASRRSRLPSDRRKVLAVVVRRLGLTRE